MENAEYTEGGSFGTSLGYNSKATYRTYNTYRLVGGELGRKFTGFRFQVSGFRWPAAPVSTSENTEYTEGGSLGTSLGFIQSPRIARITRIGSLGTSLVKILSPRIARITRMGSFEDELGRKFTGFRFQVSSFKWPDGIGFNIGKHGIH